VSSNAVRKARVVDRALAAAIALGGSLVLVAVAFLLLFLVGETLPLFRDGEVTGESPVRPPVAALAAWQDEYREFVLVLGEDGAVHVEGGDTPTRRLELPGLRTPLLSAAVDSGGRTLAVVDADGVTSLWSFRVRVGWSATSRVLTPALRETGRLAATPAARVLAVGGSGAAATALVMDAGGGARLIRTDDDVVATVPLAFPAAPVAGAVSHDGATVWVAAGSELAAFGAHGSEPLATAALPAAATAAVLLVGDTTCAVGHADGTVTAWQVVAGPVPGTRVLDRAATFRGPGAVRALAASERDKLFAVARVSGAELVHLTSRSVLAELPAFPAGLRGLAFAPRSDGLLALAGDGSVYRWSLTMPHPEATLGTMLLPVRYEGYTAAEFVWQSTGGSTGFEPKLSLIPLLVGTFKGALYALLFSAPCALAAALYVSQFAPRRLRAVVKPVIELMAAVPSVVVGFLAALFLAPLVQAHLVATLAAVVILPLAIVLAALAWQAAPQSWRRRLENRGELAVIGALLAAATVALAALEPVLERVLFDGSLQGWLERSLSVTYDQRNAVVVGFALGFAVIPIIFTLAEDAFSNVPPSLVSASLALGASRWQAARTVAIPAASPGLFAAVMVGLGRAVGETMIVLMATGNTPLLSMSPFNGFRTMAASIAVELPEAPYGGTLYRVLILTALLLFGLTFILNTAAVLVAERLRRRFGRLAA